MRSRLKAKQRVVVAVVVAADATMEADWKIAEIYEKVGRRRRTR
jgi:hypothetical protein